MYRYFIKNQVSEEVPNEILDVKLEDDSDSEEVEGRDGGVQMEGNLRRFKSKWKPQKFSKRWCPERETAQKK